MGTSCSDTALEHTRPEVSSCQCNVEVDENKDLNAPEQLQSHEGEPEKHDS